VRLKDVPAAATLLLEVGQGAHVLGGMGALIPLPLGGSRRIFLSVPPRRASPRWMDKQSANCSLSRWNFRYRHLFQSRKETPMTRLRYLGLVTLLAVMTWNASGQNGQTKRPGDKWQR
jgi:hypothetical protein